MKGEEITVLREPEEFLGTLLVSPLPPYDSGMEVRDDSVLISDDVNRGWYVQALIKRSKKRLTISSLYIGDQELELVSFHLL